RRPEAPPTPKTATTAPGAQTRPRQVSAGGEQPVLEPGDETMRDAIRCRGRQIAPEEAPAALHRLFEWQLPSPEHGAALVKDIGPARAQAIVDVALRDEPTPATVALAVDLALAEGDPDTAVDRVLQARDLVDHPYLRLRLARSREQQGRVVEAVEELRDALQRDPGVEEAQVLRGELLARLASWQAREPFDCPCGSGQAYRACCQATATRLLAEFRDGAPLQALR